MFYQKMDKSRYFLAVLLFLFAILISYGNILSAEFVWDDYLLVVDNPLIRHWHDLGRIFSSELHKNSSTNYYRPVQVLSYVLDYSLFKSIPMGYHAVNILLHFFAGVLLFSFLMRLANRYFFSVAVTLLFLVHPINVSAVAYISGRADLLTAIFVFSSLIFYLKAFHLRVSPEQYLSKKNFGCYSLSLVMCIFALLTKETAIALPFALWGLDMFFLKRKNSVKSVGPFIAVVFVYLCARITFLNFSSGNPLLCKKGFAVFDVGLFSRCAIFFKTLLIYIGSLLFPVNLHMERIIAREHVHMFHYASVVLCVLLCFLALRRITLSLKSLIKLFVFAVFWFFVWLMPQSAFVLPKIMADHFIYLSSIGIFIIMALFIDTWRVRKIILAILCVYFCSFTWMYNQIWNNELSFFCWTAEHAPFSYKVHDCLADLYLKMDRPDDAIREYQFILNRSFGIVCDKDIDVLSQKTGLSYDGDKKREIASSVFYNLGVVYFQRGRLHQARVAYVNALKLNPESEQAYNNLGLAYMEMGDLSKAEEMYKKAIGLNKRYLQPYNNLAVLYAQERDFNKAVIFWKEVLKINPGYEMAKKNIALARELVSGQGR